MLAAVAEIILKLGCGLVGWLLVFSHGLVLAVTPAADCSTELWRASLIFAVGAGVAALFLLPAALPWAGHLRWCALPAAGLWIAGAWLAAPLVATTTFGGQELCAALAGMPTAEPGAPPWQRAWPPVQFAAIAGCAWQALRYWRRDDAEAATPRPPR